jgi:hypothetical protein
MSRLQQASFQLRHGDISTNPNQNSVYHSTAGNWTNNKIDTTWNIDLQKIMGHEMFSNYTLFGLRLNQVSFAANNYQVNTKDGQLSINMKGLNWSNCSYDVGINQITDTAILGSFLLPPTGITSSLSPNVSVMNFNKTTPQVALSIDLRRIIDFEQPDVEENTYLPSGVYSFSVFGIR